MNHRGFTLIEIAVATALLLVVGLIAITVTRAASQTVVTAQDGAALETELSIARQTLQSELTSAPLLGIRNASADYIQVVYARESSDLKIDPRDVLALPGTARVELYTLPVQNGLGAFSNGMGHINLVPYTVGSGRINLTNNCVAGVEYTPNTRFFGAGTLEIATGSAIQRYYPNTPVEPAVLYIRRDSQPWRPLLSGATQTTVGITYSNQRGEALRTPNQSQAPWQVEPEDLPGSVYPKPAFVQNNQLYRQQSLVLYAEARQGESVRRYDLAFPLTFYPGHAPTQLTECGPEKPAIGDLILDIQAPPGFNRPLVEIRGSDPLLDGKRFGPGRYEFKVRAGGYQLRHLHESSVANNIGVYVNPDGSKAATLLNPARPADGYQTYQANSGFTVASFTPTQVEVKVEPAPAILRLLSRNFYVAFPLQMQIVPFTGAPATPPPAFFTPQGERVVMGHETLLSHLITAATPEAQQGASSSWLITNNTIPTSNDERAKKLVGNEDQVKATYIGVGWPPYNAAFGTVGYPAGEYYGALLVRPGTYKKDYSYWFGAKLGLQFAFFIPIVIVSPCVTVPVDWGRDFTLNPAESTLLRWEAVCMP